MGVRYNWNTLVHTLSHYTMFSVLNGQKDTPVHSLDYLRLTAVTLMTTVSNVHASKPVVIDCRPISTHCGSLSLSLSELSNSLNVVLS